MLAAGGAGSPADAVAAPAAAPRDFAADMIEAMEAAGEREDAEDAAVARKKKAAEEAAAKQASEEEAATTKKIKAAEAAADDAQMREALGIS